MDYYNLQVSVVDALLKNQKAGNHVENIESYDYSSDRHKAVLLEKFIIADAKRMAKRRGAII